MTKNLLRIKGKYLLSTHILIFLISFYNSKIYIPFFEYSYSPKIYYIFFTDIIKGKEKKNTSLVSLNLASTDYLIKNLTSTSDSSNNKITPDNYANNNNKVHVKLK